MDEEVVYKSIDKNSRYIKYIVYDEIYDTLVVRHSLKYCSLSKTYSIDYKKGLRLKGGEEYGFIGTFKNMYIFESPYDNEDFIFIEDENKIDYTEYNIINMKNFL